MCRSYGTFWFCFKHLFGGLKPTATKHTFGGLKPTATKWMVPTELFGKARRTVKDIVFIKKNL